MNTQPQTIDKESFKRWLARQPDTRVFNYVSNYKCMFCAFVREELGWPTAYAMPDYVQKSKNAGAILSIPQPFHNAAAIASSYGTTRDHFTIAAFKSELAKQLHRETL